VSPPGQRLLVGLKVNWGYLAVALAVGVSAVLLRPPLELTNPHRLVTASIAAVSVLAVVLVSAYLFIRFPRRSYWTWWAGVSLVATLALAAALVKYQELRSLHSVDLDGTSVVVGTTKEFTALGNAHFEQFHDSPEMTLRKIGRPDVAWDIQALKRHARELERYYYLCEALIALLGMSLIGVWRSRQPARGTVVETRAEPRAQAGSGQRTKKRFRVALSYPGEFRDRVANIATILEGAIGKDAVFYDKWYAAELARPNLDLYLQNIYKFDSELLVILLCAEYEAKDWCGLEWRVVRELIKNREGERVMLLRLDDAPISGLLSIDGYLDIASLSDPEAADAILSRTASSTDASARTD
jgi:hypothetical protein